MDPGLGTEDSLEFLILHLWNAEITGLGLGFTWYWGSSPGLPA